MQQGQAIRFSVKISIHCAVVFPLRNLATLLTTTFSGCRKKFHTPIQKPMNKLNKFNTNSMNTFATSQTSASSVANQANGSKSFSPSTNPDKFGRKHAKMVWGPEIGCLFALYIYIVHLSYKSYDKDYDLQS